MNKTSSGPGYIVLNTINIFDISSLLEDLTLLPLCIGYFQHVYDYRMPWGYPVYRGRSVMSSAINRCLNGYRPRQDLWYMLRATAASTAPSACFELFLLSISLSCIPNQWKNCFVVPIPKSSDPYAGYQKFLTSSMIDALSHMGQCCSPRYILL